MSQMVAFEGEQPDSRQAALELHRLLKDIDTARWRAGLASVIRARAADLSRRFGELWRASPSVPIATRAGDIAALLDQLPEGEEQAAWTRFRSQLSVAYEALSISLRAEQVELPSLRPTNYARSAFHVLVSVVVLFLIEMVLVGEWLVIVPAIFAGTFWSLEMARQHSRRARTFLVWLLGKIAHPHETYRINSSTWFATALTILGFAFEPMLCALGVIILGLADPAAGLVGRRWGRTKLVGQRSVEGTLTFAVVGFVAALVVLSVWHGDQTLGARLIIAACASVAGAVAELFSRRVDDNFSIPLSAAFGGLVGVALIG